MAQILSPKIVTDNLVLCLDPSQNKSLPTSALPVKDGLVMWMDAADDSTFSFASPAQQTVTITIASPAVITLTSHGLSVGDKIYFTTTGALPTGITASAFYYVSVVDSANAFKISATLGGSNVNTSGTQSGTHYLYDTTQVSQWRDKSGYNYHMTPKSAGPVRRTALNSKKVLRFTTSQTIGNNTINLSASANTVFAVTRLTGTTNGRVLTCNLDASGNNWLLGHHGGTVNDYYAEGWIYDSATAADTTWRIFMGDWSGSSTDLANFYSNGTALATNNTQASQGPNKIGINYYSNETCTCEAAEIIIYNRVLSSKERQLVHTYLGQKWGISNTDRSIIDLSGNNNHGLLGNGTVADMPAVDYYNKGALRFDGSTDYLVVADNFILNPINVTVSMWLKRNAYQSSICNFLRRNDRDAYALMATYNTDAVWFRIRNAAAAVVDATTTMPLNTWTNLVGTFDGSNVKIYKNGALANTTANTSSISYSGSTIGDLIIARDDIVSGRYAPINVGSVMIYSRALDATEISQNYETQKSKFADTIIQQGLVLNLDAGNPYSYAGSGTTWYDVSGNSNDSTLINAPIYKSENGGSILFNGVNNYIALNGGSSINNWNPDGISASTSYRSYTSANVWFRSSTIDTGGVNKMIFSDNFLEYGFYQNNSTLYLNAVAGQSTAIVANQWYNACLVADIGRPAIGTYSQSGTTTITCTTTYPLTFSTGNTVSISFTKTAGPDAVPLSQNYVVTVTGANTFTITSGASATSSGSIIYSHSSNTSTITAYINGIQVGSSVTSNTSNGANDAPFNIGRDNGSATSYFAGNIAIFQLYNRQLTAAEVLQNYNATKSRFGL